MAKFMLCESFFRPDFSDVTVKLEWLRRNPAIAKKIAGAGRIFLMSHFGEMWLSGNSTLPDKSADLSSYNKWKSRQHELGYCNIGWFVFTRRTFGRSVVQVHPEHDPDTGHIINGMSVDQIWSHQLTELSEKNSFFSCLQSALSDASRASGPPVAFSQCCGFP
jgi:hypothetical protein